MKQNEKTRKLITMHCRQFPDLQIRDLFKFIYQSSFGCEHMISSLTLATDYIRKEYKSIATSETLIVPLDGEYSRVHLAYLTKGLTPETLGKLFFKSAKKEDNGISELENKLCVAKELVRENILPFSLDEFDKELTKWKSDGYPSVHHSDIFRNKYKPSYRVISNKYIPFLPLFAELDKLLKDGPKAVAIEGGSVSGKTTLGEILEEIYDCTVIHMDNFFLRPQQRTKVNS